MREEKHDLKAIIESFERNEPMTPFLALRKVLKKETFDELRSNSYVHLTHKRSKAQINDLKDVIYQSFVPTITPRNNVLDYICEDRKTNIKLGRNQILITVHGFFMKDYSFRMPTHYEIEVSYGKFLNNGKSKFYLEKELNSNLEKISSHMNDQDYKTATKEILSIVDYSLEKIKKNLI